MGARWWRMCVESPSTRWGEARCVTLDYVTVTNPSSLAAWFLCLLVDSIPLTTFSGDNLLVFYSISSPPMLPSKTFRAFISQYPGLCRYVPCQMSSIQRSQIIHAPSEEPINGVKSIFLAGTIYANDKVDWREKLSASLSAHPITVYNPNRPDWDSTWREDITFTPYREQVLWELDKQAKADLVVVYFHPATAAPISLLEFGLSAQIPGKVIAVAPKGYSKRGNVQIVCQKFGIEFLENIDSLDEVIVKKLSLSDQWLPIWILVSQARSKSCAMLTEKGMFTPRETWINRAKSYGSMYTWGWGWGRLRDWLTLVIVGSNSKTIVKKSDSHGSPWAYGISGWDGAHLCATHSFDIQHYGRRGFRLV